MGNVKIHCWSSWSWLASVSRASRGDCTGNTHTAYKTVGGREVGHWVRRRIADETCTERRTTVRTTVRTCWSVSCRWRLGSWAGDVSVTPESESEAYVNAGCKGSYRCKGNLRSQRLEVRALPGIVGGFLSARGTLASGVSLHTSSQSVYLPKPTAVSPPSVLSRYAHLAGQKPLHRGGIRVACLSEDAWEEDRTALHGTAQVHME